MWMFKLTSDHSTRVEWVTKLLGIDDMNLRPKPKISLTKSFIYHNKMVHVFIFSFSFLKRLFMLWKCVLFVDFTTMLWRWYDVYCLLFNWLNAFLLTSFGRSWICTWLVIFILIHDMLLLYFDFLAMIK
jgi:hypothetical protein